MIQPGIKTDGLWAGLLGALGVADRRGLLLFVLSGMAAVFLGFKVFAVPELEQLIMHGGWYFMTALFVTFVWLAVLVHREAGRPVWPGWVPVLAVVAGTIVVLITDGFHSKILFDEYCIQDTAMGMHLSKQVGVVYRAYWLDGSYIPLDLYLDKRPYFFAYLISLLHDLTGYRTANVFIVNAALIPVLLGLAYRLAWSMAGRLAGCIAVALLATLPLLGQCATSGSMEMHNLTMLALAMCAAQLYLERPGRERLGLLCVCAALLAQSRYESIIYVLAVGAVILLGWARERRVISSPVLLLTPLMFVPAVWHSRFLDSKPSLWELKPGQTQRFSLDYLKGNLEGLWNFYSHAGILLPNSLFLGVCGLLGVAALAWLGWRRYRQPGTNILRGSWLAVLCFGCVCLGTLVLMQFYYWGRFDDPMATRFSLPSYLLAALCGGAALALIVRRQPRLAGVFWVLWAVNFQVFFIPAISNRIFTITNMVEAETVWELAVVKARPEVPRLIISGKSTLHWVANKIPVVMVERARLRMPQIYFHVVEGTFHEVLVVQVLRPTTIEGDYAVDKDDVLPPEVKLETVALKRFGGRLERISRIVFPPPGSAAKAAPATAVEAPVAAPGGVSSAGLGGTSR